MFFFAHQFFLSVIQVPSLDDMDDGEVKSSPTSTQILRNWKTHQDATTTISKQQPVAPPPMPPPRTTTVKNVANSTKSNVLMQPMPNVPKTIFASPRQKNNPIMKEVKNVNIEYKDDVVPDFIMNKDCCAFYISCKYHAAKPEYLKGRLASLNKFFAMRVILCHVDSVCCCNYLTIGTERSGCTIDANYAPVPIVQLYVDYVLLCVGSGTIY